MKCGVRWLENWARKSHVAKTLISFWRTESEDQLLNCLLLDCRLPDHLGGQQLLHHYLPLLLKTNRRNTITMSHHASRDLFSFASKESQKRTYGFGFRSEGFASANYVCKTEIQYQAPKPRLCGTFEWLQRDPHFAQARRLAKIASSPADLI